MINPDQSIPCPVCQTKIPFDTKQLLLGVQSACPNCDASIGLSDGSKPLVQETMEKFEAVKGQFPKE